MGTIRTIMIYFNETHVQAITQNYPCGLAHPKVVTLPSIPGEALVEAPRLISQLDSLFEEIRATE